MTRFAVLPLGVGEFFARRLYNCCFTLFLGDKIVQVDCPEPFRRMLSEASTAVGMELDYRDIEDLIVTHLHGDHSNGIEGLGLWNYYKEQKRVRLYTSPEVLEDLWPKLQGSMSWKRDANGVLTRVHKLEDYFAPTSWPMGSTQKLYGATFETHSNNHPIATFGFKVRFEGRSLGYSCDTAFDLEYIKWLSDCDLIIHECNLPPAHTAYEELMTVDASIRAKMRLTHIADDFDEANSAIKPLKQGELLDVMRGS